MLAELRHYRCLPNMLPAVLSRFKTTTYRLFHRHGIQAGPLMTNLIGPNNADLLYVITWSSLSEREAKWNAFINDPEWTACVCATEAHGPLIEWISNRILAVQQAPLISNGENQ